MAGELSEFGRIELLDVESIGQPGNRRFRLFARSARGHTAGLWAEREQLEQLAAAIDKLLARLSGAMVLRTEAQASAVKLPQAPDDFPAEPEIEFQIGQMELGYDKTNDIVILRATPFEVVERDGALEVRENVESRFGAAISRTHAERLSVHIAVVLSAGRPRCPLCGLPMEPAHVCEKQNGYHPVGLN